MNLGELNQKIEIQSATDKRNLIGDVNQEDWKTISKPWAKVEFISGRQYIQAKMTEVDVTARFTIRKRNVTTLNRVVHNCQVYEINAVNPIDDGREFMEILGVADVFDDDDC